MAHLTPAEITDAVFQRGPWVEKRNGDLSLRRGFQILTGQLGFPQRKVPLHYQVLRHAGIVLLAKRFNAFAKEGEFPEMEAGILLPEKMPALEFDIEHPSGLKAACEDKLDRLLLQARIDEGDFRGELRIAYLETLRGAKPEQFEMFGLAAGPENIELAQK